MVDAVSMATQLAALEVGPSESRATLQLATLAEKRSALNSINSDLGSLKGFISDLNGYNNSVIKNSATSSDEELLTASAGAGAQPGSYQIFIEQLAQSHQLATQLPAGNTQDSLVPNIGEITFEMNGENFSVDLGSAIDADAELDYMGLITRINADPDNMGISASLVRTNGSIQMLLTSQESGEKNQIKVSSHTNNLAFNRSMNSTNMTELVKNSDSVAWLGEQNSGIRLQSDSNTLSGVIDGVDIELEEVHELGDAPVTLDIGSDRDATNESMQEFVDKYNAVLAGIKKFSRPGSESEERGVLASDPVSKGIVSSLRPIMQQSFSGTSTSELGLEFDRSGNMTFDSDKLAKFQETSTVNIDEIFRGEGMLLSQMEDKLDVYSNSSTGSLKSQLESIDSQKDRANDKLETLDRKYEMYYARYLKQFSALSGLEAKMAKISNLF